MRMREHRVAPGENLADISVQYYGKPDYALVIFQHNRDVLTNPKNIYVGQELVIPHIPHFARVFG